MIKPIPIFLIAGCLIINLLMPSISFSKKMQLVINADMQFLYADKLFAEKDFETSLIEFKRFIHFFSNDQQTEKQKIELARYKTGICLFKLKRFYQAAKIFNKIILKNQTNDITTESVFSQSQAFEHMGNNAYAQIVLQNYLKLTENRHIKDRIYTNLVRIQLNLIKNSKQESYKDAKKYLSKISLAGLADQKIQQYTKLIHQLENTPQKDPKTAGLSAIIPGGGFLYCGRYKDAFMALALNTGLTYAAYEAFDNNQPVLGALIGIVEAGFYAGNIYGSVSSAYKYNKHQKLNILEQDLSVSHIIDPINQSFGILLNYDF